MLKENEFYCIDALKGLQKLPDESVDAIITSLPYWGLRDYGVKGQLGHEDTLEQHLQILWRIFDEVRRVLRKDGTCWINLGDSYGEKVSWKKRHPATADLPSVDDSLVRPKCLKCVPERFAIGMIARGWFLRNKIIWHKPNPLPMPIRDRFTNHWEYVFLFTKSHKYYFDLHAVRVPHKEDSIRRMGQAWNGQRPKGSSWQHFNMSKACHPLGKNPGDCWTIPTKGFKGAHFATFPEKLIERPILTTPEAICKNCGQPKTRITKRIQSPGTRNISSERAEQKIAQHLAQPKSRYPVRHIALGWKSCTCNAGFRPALVLDPFMGAGTTAVVAKKLGRNFIGFELNPSYVKMAQERLASTKPESKDSSKKAA